MAFSLSFSKISKSDHNEVFLLYKSAFQAIIEEAFGWNEEFQNNRFQTKYDLDSFYWIEFNSQRIGYVCYFETASELHVSLLVLFDIFRNKTYGRTIMNSLQQRAVQKSINVTLSSFKNNKGAVRFYRNLGYDIVSEDKYFYDMNLRV